MVKKATGDSPTPAKPAAPKNAGERTTTTSGPGQTGGQELTDAQKAEAKSRDAEAAKTAAEAPAAGETASLDAAAATANVAGSAASRQGFKVPPAPGAADDTPAAGLRAAAEAAVSGQLDRAANGAFGAPGSTLNPADPAAPNAHPGITGTERTGGTVDGLGADQSIDQGTTLQPVANLGLTGAASVEYADDDPNKPRWSEEDTPRGRRVAISSGGGNTGTVTFEETLPPGADDVAYAAARNRLLARLAQ